MCTLQIEHAIVDYPTWKAAFDRDPIGRRQAGVRSYRVSRPVDDPRYVIIQLDFDEAAAARTFLKKLQGIWRQAELTPGLSRQPGAEPPRALIIDEVERG